MQNWEYFRLVTYFYMQEWKLSFKGVEHPLQDIDDVLTELGAEGWEMVGISSTIDSDYFPGGAIDPEQGFRVQTKATSYYFKRPKAPVRQIDVPKHN